MKKIFFGITIALVIVIAFGGSLFAYNLSKPSVEAQSANENPRAAIIDQLDTDFPSPEFHQKAIEYLQSGGYEVDVFTTEDITVNFYKKLPSFQYDFVIIRTHGAADEENNDTVTLFTGEKYQEDKYISEQLFGEAKRVTPLYQVTYDTTKDNSEWIIVNDTYRIRSSPVEIETSSSEEYFAITPKLIEQSTQGKFSGTTIILGGCNTMKTNSMAESLVKKGASDVIGWSDEITWVENDHSILLLLEKLMISKISMEEALDDISKIRDERYYPAQMMHYS